MQMHSQRGSTLIGFIIGLLVGLGVALAVAIYVTKVPVSFLNKGASRSAEQDAAEEKKNKDWDPNAPLYGKGKSAEKSDAKADDKPVDKAPERKPDAASKVDPKSADPIADLAKVKAAEPKPSDKPAETKPAETKATDSADPFVYFVQAGAYRSNEEAEAQRAKTALLGLDSKISERDQGGRTVYRVRMGPMDKVEAERVRAKLEAAHIESAMVRVQR
jgi:cell division protein FtsN